jgi:hypothetical protein
VRSTNPLVVKLRAMLRRTDEEIAAAREGGELDKVDRLCRRRCLLSDRLARLRANDHWPAPWLGR